MRTVREVYSREAIKLIENSRAAGHITEDHVFQEANRANREIIDEIVAGLLLPGSRIENIQGLRDLYQLSSQGKSCLILMEHYSNFDIPALHYMIHHSGPEGFEIAESIIPMAGMKLNQESEFVRAFTEAYSRLVIYPSRSLRTLEGTETWAEEKRRARAINMAALQQMVRKKHEGKIILLFPSGTRYRPGAEETRKGLPEVDSYLRAFDYVLPIGIAGNILRVNGNATMADDFVVPDVVIFQAGQVQEASQVRSTVRQSTNDSQDPKQAVADTIMAELLDLHRQAKRLRAPLLPPNHPADDDFVDLGDADC